MAVLRDLQYAKPMQTYAPMDFKPLDDLGTGLEVKYNKNKEGLVKSRAALKALQVRTPYQPLVDGVVGDTRKQLEALSKRQDLENIGSELLDVTTAFDENATVRAALKDKAAYDEYKTSQQKRVGSKENGIRQSQYDRALSYSDATNSEIKYDGEGNPITIFKGYNSVENQDISGAMMDMVKDWKESKKPLTYTDSKGKKHEYVSTPKGYLRVQDNTYVDEAEVANALRMVVSTNPAYAELIKEEAMFKINNVTKGSEFNLSHLAALGVGEEELTTFLKDQGIDTDKAKSSPAFLEGIAEAMLSTQIADGFINPAAMKAGFEKLDSQYMTDNVLMEGIKAANSLNLEKYKQDRTDAREAKKAQKEFDANLTISNEGVISTKEPVPTEKILENVREKEAQLKTIERNLQAHAAGQGTGEYSDLMNEKDRLTSEIAMAKGTYTTKVTNFKETVEYESYIDEAYKEYEKAYKTFKGSEIGTAKLSKSEFSLELEKPYTSKDIKTPKSHFRQLFGETNSVEINRRETGLNNHIISASQGFKSKVDSSFSKRVQSDPKAANSVTFNLLNEPDLGKTKSGTIRQLNTLHTQHAIENGSEYQMADSGISLDEALRLVRIKYPTASENDLKVEMTITDGEFEAGFPFAVTVTNKKTKEKLLQNYAIPANGGVEERDRAGKYLMANSKPGESTYEQGLSMVASAAFPQLSKLKVAPQLGSITEKSTSKTRPAVSAPIQIGADDYRVIKRRHTYRDSQGNPIGTNTVYELAKGNDIVDDQGNLVRSNISNYIVNSDVPASSPPEEQILFRSIDDIQRRVYLLSVSK